MDQDNFEAIKTQIRDYVRSTVVQNESLIEETDEIPAGIRQVAKDMGLFGFAIPAAYDGLGLSMEEESELVIELGYATPTFRSMFGTNNGIAGHVLIEGGTEEQKSEWLPRLASGEITASFALTEPDSGSDPSGLTTAAVRDGEGWTINGTKRYITNAPIADLFLVFARTDSNAEPSRGISTFLVPRSSPGLVVGPRDRKMGQFGAWTADVQLDDVKVGPEALVGGPSGENNGWRTAMRCFAHGRIHIAAVCVGMADRLVDESVRYSQERRQGGRPIARFQLLQGLIADSVTDLYAGRALVLDAARRFDSRSDRRMAPSIAKYFCSEMVGRVADRAVQIHGGAGYMRGTVAERLFRDARLFRIYEGTSQIQQVIIARQAIGAATEE